ncbi:two-component system response regulator BtsR [Mesoterricola sediminis]|uniref:DNA-binding response regulator n=1 Tax=Mesoterricola sediminis TaxID=2927980 RepID=A0AA48KAZ1_9BACT|nr:two-component system response regulator BtsR [Mesoterricola sediminis]BDU75574.1 DNA-binding response regulator [Mesoterricola sediminis]
MIRAVVVDNEQNARDELEALLADHADVAVVGACGNAIQALRTVRAARPDLLLVDIHMPKVDGFQLVAMIEPELMPCVVFVTAHDEYALKAFEENAVDYLLKPVAPERLARMLDKVRRYLGEGTRPAYQSPAIDRIPCVCSQGIRLVQACDVECVQSGDTGVHLVTAQGQFLTELTLATLEARVPRLTRCHKQFLVNLDHVDLVGRPDPATVVLSTRSGRQVPVSRRYLAGLKERLGI